MMEILTDLSPAAQAVAVKANLYEFFRSLARWDQTDFYAGLDYTRWQTSVPHTWFNGVLLPRPASAVADAEALIATARAYFRSRRAASFTCWLAPELKPADWRAPLQAAGFRYDNNTPGMAAPLDALNEDRPVPAGFHVAPVDGLAALKVWTEVFVAGYPIPPSWQPGLYALLAGLGLELPMRNYTGFLNGRPVATSNLFLGAGVGGVQFVATLPEARGKGIGAQMTLAALRDARAAGCRLGILQSSELGYPVYRRLGLKLVCDVDYFTWAPA